MKLTQYGEKPPVGDGFRDKLRPEIGETEISLILGEVDSAAASMLVTKMFQAGADRRVTTAEQLRARNFRVVHSPTRGNPLHVSVFPPDQAPDEPADWDDAMADAFNACFTEDGNLGGDCLE
ncbi:hypothetical protein [Streptomyces sp. NPDC093071]|uniref:hypothetical protein n=1 Tax=Streptomyces sp. NPDC093071 TaxID=3366022 RepID=UPI0037F52A45